MTTVPQHAHEGKPSYITIPLTQGYKAIVDPEDADLTMYKWQIARGRYAMRRSRLPGKKTKGPAIIMHRVILERRLGRSLLPGAVVDHINGDGLDNRRANLREATTSQNAANRNYKADKGVKFKRGKWEASIGYHGRVIYIGTFNTKPLAVEAYDLAKVELFGEYARTYHAYVQTQLWSILQDAKMVRLGYSTAARAENAPPLSELLREKEDSSQKLGAITHANEDGSSSIAIPINKGKFVLVDPIDADLADVKWFLSTGRYARRRTEKNCKGTIHTMHRIILERKLGRPIVEGMVVDHINGDGLDNRRKNLREATQIQNMRNLRLRSDNTSRYKGVKQLTPHTWEARINEQTIGYFDTAEDASFAYDKAALEQYGEFACINHPIEKVLGWVPPVRQFGKKSASGYRGVQACGDRWQAIIHEKKQATLLGFFDTADEAAFAYDKAALEMHGLKAQLNHSLEEVEVWVAPVRRLRKTNSSGFRGITKVGKKWAASVNHKYLGLFDTPEQAARAYDKANLALRGDSALLNFPREDYEHGGQ